MHDADRRGAVPGDRPVDCDLRIKQPRPKSFRRHVGQINLIEGLVAAPERSPRCVIGLCHMPNFKRIHRILLVCGGHLNLAPRAADAIIRVPTAPTLQGASMLTMSAPAFLTSRAI